MTTQSQMACERCGRILSRTRGCPRHRGAPMLDLRREEDRAWRAEVISMRQHRYLRMATAWVGTLGMVGGLVALTDLVGVHPTLPSEQGSDATKALSLVLHGLSTGLVIGTVVWGGFGLLRLGTRRKSLVDPIDRQALDRERAKRATAICTAVIFAIATLGLREFLVGVPAELAAAALSLACVPPLLALSEYRSTPPAFPATSAEPLPPPPLHQAVDTRIEDPLEQARKRPLRASIMSRR